MKKCKMVSVFTSGYVNTETFYISFEYFINSHISQFPLLSLVHNRQLILTAPHSALNTAFLYRAMFGAFVLFGCWD